MNRSGVFTFALCVLLARAAGAQEQSAPMAPPPTPPPPAAAPPPANPPAPAAPSEAAVAEAKQRYRRALELFDEGSFDAALLEMRRAYSLAPSFRMLYNLGLINVQLNDYAAALEVFQRYLSEGGNEVPPERVTEVEQRMEKLRGRVGFIRVESNVPAEITVDDVVVGQTPLAKPLRVNAGKRKVGARAPQRVPDTKVIELAGGDNASVSFNLVDPTTIVTVQRTEEPGRPEAWIAWGGTALLAGGTTVFAILASNANSDYKTRQNTFGVTSGELHDANRKAAGLSLTADLLGVGTLLAAGAAVYLTIRPKKADSGPAPASPSSPPKSDTEGARLFVRPGLGSFAAGATF